MDDCAVILTERNWSTQKNLPQFTLVDRTSHMSWPGFEPRHVHWYTSD